MRFAKIPETAFQEIQLNAGVILNSFNVDSVPAEAELLKSIVGATSGGVNFTATPTYTDFGEDIDNCPKNTMEMKKLDTYDIKLSGTYVTINATNVQSLIAAADVSGNKITPRADLSTDDFKELWWVGDYSDKNNDTNGGMIAIHMMNTLSTGGFAIKSSDKAKGTFAFEYAAHYSITDPDTVPFEVYVVAGTEAA